MSLCFCQRLNSFATGCLPKQKLQVEKLVQKISTSMNLVIQHLSMSGLNMHHSLYDAVMEVSKILKKNIKMLPFL